MRLFTLDAPHPIVQAAELVLAREARAALAATVERLSGPQAATAARVRG